MRINWDTYDIKSICMYLQLSEISSREPAKLQESVGCREQTTKTVSRRTHFAEDHAPVMSELFD